MWRVLLASVLCCGLSFWPGTALHANAVATQRPVNALYLLSEPPDYEAFKDLINGFKESGAEAVIIRPVSRTGVLNRKMLAKCVFFAHSAGLKLFVLLPTRDMQHVLVEHPEWQDQEYDVRTDRLQPSGRLDLFNPYVTVYLTDLFRDIAEYSVDGMILDEDYNYRDTEGMSELALTRYKKKYGTSFPIGKTLRKIKGTLLHDHVSDGYYGQAFWNMAELKKGKLLLLLQNIIQASRAENKEMLFAVALHVPGLFLTEKELLAWYAHDLDAFRKLDVNFFWLAIPHREIQLGQDANYYKKSIETVSRIAVSSVALVNDPAKMAIALQTVSPDGKPLALSEIEEVTAQVRKTGDTGIALMVGPDSRLPPELTRKIFRGMESQ